ncbi:multidrug effflux MFS transporter [Halomonas sp. MCCC 1A17488]|uniref:Bcr/CflA family efflux transporter n=1 Tax=Billgrantia sulfidoxydans TaxID=2733484 RepID=A0ABX7VYE6_9GAMM|nr:MULTISPECIES: multidrug effflux MFS transporter [Halomonas]MCE8017166.1 multidrug effflux MFS transporter [Halomonas sp. MCCC 1A17488]MCG3240499.1 multidrug effflux MFS transporter [Halomonas sp. MCCC 1A17488]QPP49644.1 multidrug effflux MFS transporter [Halomonas sp. SS10-MC5]QTP53253.1 multidrug effflux MFS transporter [Halomonas sulfidoxydans]
MLRLKSPAMVITLAALTALGPLATDMYLPAMPAMAAALDTGPDQIQLTLSLYMAGFAVAQLFCGPISDRFGRRPVMIAGFGLFLLASLLCAFAPSIEWLLAGRFLQALGGAAGPVLGRAAVRDIHGPIEAGRVLSYMASTMALAPALAPIVGAGLLLFFGWESIFVLLTIYAAAMLLVLAFLMPEPLARENRQSVHPATILQNYRMLLGQRAFMGYTLVNASGFTGLFAFLSGSSFVLIEFMGMSPFGYGIGFTLIVAGFFSGTLISGRFSHRLGRDRLLLLATSICALAGLTMAGLAAAAIYTPWAVIGPHILFLVGFGIVMPQSMSGALAPNPQCAGSASSLFGFLQMTLAALGGALVGRFHDGTSLTMAVSIGLGGVLSLLAYLLLVRPASQAAAAGQAGSSR